MFVAEGLFFLNKVFEILNFLAENFVFIYMGLSLFTFNKHRWYPGFILASFVSLPASVTPQSMLYSLTKLSGRDIDWTYS